MITAVSVFIEQVGNIEEFKNTTIIHLPFTIPSFVCITMHTYSDTNVSFGLRKIP